MHTEPSYKIHLCEESAEIFSIFVLNCLLDIPIHKSLPDHILLYYIILYYFILN